MKKLKIFLMLSILLCFGLFFNNVYASSKDDDILSVSSTITNLTGTKWLLPENLNSTSYIDGNFDIDISPYEIELNRLLKLYYPSYEAVNSITTWEELLDIASYLISDMGGTNVVNNLVIENDKNNYLIVPTNGYLEILSDEGYGHLYYGLDLASADNMPIVSGILTFEHPIDGTLSFNFVELFHFFLNTSGAHWLEIPIANESSIIDPLFSTMTITGGTDVTNPTLIAWLEANATLLSAPKILEIGDELPAGYVKISWDFTNKPLPDLGEGNSFMIMGIGSDSGIDIEITQYELPSYGYYREMYIEYGTGYGDNIEERFILDTPSYTIISLPEPVLIETIDDDDEDYYEFIHGAIFWEVVPPEYLIDYDDLYDGELLDIEEGTILPASIIGINLVFYNTGGYKNGTVVFSFLDIDTGYTYGQIIVTAQEDDLGRKVASAKINVQDYPWWDIYTIDDTLADQSFGSTRGTLFAGILLDFSMLPPEARTIAYITIEGDLEMDVIFTRILTEEELAYQEGYSNGYTTARGIFGWKYGDNWYNGIDAWYLGEKYAREMYGYYDSSTDEWLSVSEYLERYGTGNGTTPTDPTSPTDFYANFDKYFIPAMIIVFGGAILITALKVFKGRE